MTPLASIVMVFAAIVLLVALLFRKLLLKAGPGLLVPLILLVIASGATAAYSNYSAHRAELAMQAQASEESGGPGGGPGGGRERSAHQAELRNLVRKLPVLDAQEGRALSAEQAAKLLEIAAPLRTLEKLEKEPTLALVAKAKAVLTPEQLTAFDAIELPRISRRGRRRRRPAPEATTRTAAPASAGTPGAAATTTARPDGREARPDGQQRRRGRRGGFDPTANPFMRERYKPALDALTSLLEQRAGKTSQASAPVAKPAGD